jgi:hypothetical protein
MIVSAIMARSFEAIPPQTTAPNGFRSGCINTMAQASWRNKISNTNQQPRPVRRQSVEAPQLVAAVETRFDSC